MLPHLLIKTNGVSSVDNMSVNRPTPFNHAIIGRVEGRVAMRRIARPSGVVARLLPFLSSPLVAATQVGRAASAAGKADAPPLWATHPGDGCRSHGSSLVGGGVVSVPRGSVTWPTGRRSWQPAEKTRANFSSLYKLVPDDADVYIGRIGRWKPQKSPSTPRRELSHVKNGSTRFLTM